MKRNTSIALFYTGIGIFCIVFVSFSMWLRKGLDSPYLQPPVASNQGKETVNEWFEIAKDLPGVNQDNQAVKLSDLRGKVWLVSEFFAVCPQCAIRNGAELREVYDMFKSNPDFHLTCISVDPEVDTHEKLSDYAQALGAETKNWWFFNGGETKATQDYLEQELKFFGIRVRTDQNDIESNGKYAHDLGLILVDRNFKVIGKWPLADARSEDAKRRDPLLYQKLKTEMYARIRLELEKKSTTAN
jgi:protein SCO1